MQPDFSVRQIWDSLLRLLNSPFIRLRPRFLIERISEISSVPNAGLTRGPAGGRPGPLEPLVGHDLREGCHCDRASHGQRFSMRLDTFELVHGGGCEIGLAAVAAGEGRNALNDQQAFPLSETAGYKPMMQLGTTAVSAGLRRRRR